MARRGGQDRSINDALKTTERLALWLDTAIEEDAWRQAEDPIQAVMLHGMLVHLREQIDEFIALGGDEVQETVHALRALAARRT